MARAVATEVREVTDEEVRFYQENGWVKLDGLISSNLAAEIHEKVLFMETAEVEEGGAVHDRPLWRDWYFPGRDEGVEPIRSLAYSKEIGRNAQRFVGREVPINYHADMMAVKMPVGHAASHPTGWHQDWVNFPFDRAGFLTFWIAIGDIPPERGAMRFLQGSQQAGPLGKMGLTTEVDLVGYYPDLPKRYPISPPIHLRPGDATVHNGLVVHGAPENSTDQPRWALICSYHPGDTCYTGAPHHIFRPDIGLEVGKPIKHELFRVVYP
jgi:hypothetical protein